MNIYPILLFTAVLSMIFKWIPNEYDYNTAWKKLEEQLELGLPKSALKIAEEIFNTAKHENNSPQKIKALIYIGRINVQFEEEKAAEVYVSLVKETETSQEPEKSILKSITADFLAQYYNLNAWKISTKTDIETNSIDWSESNLDNWSSNQFQKNIITLYEESIKNPKIKSVAAKDYVNIFENYNDKNIDLAQNIYRILIWRYIKHLENIISTTRSNSGKLQKNAQKLLMPRPDFASARFDSLEEYDGKLLNRLQTILKEEAEENNTHFMAETDLYRLKYYYRNSHHPDKEKYYLNTLEWMANAYINVPTYSEIAHAIADHWYYKHEDENRNLKALQWIERAEKNFPNSYGTILCKRLKNAILASSLSIQNETIATVTEEVLLLANWKNCKNLYIKLVEAPLHADNLFKTWSNDSIKTAWLKQQRILKSWEFSLKDHGKHLEYTEEFNLGKIPLGNYFLFYSPEEDFSTDVQYNLITISNMAAAQIQGSEDLQILVAHRISGKPMEGIKVEFFQQEYDRKTRSSSWRTVGTALTNKAGICIYPVKNRSLRAVITADKDIQNIGYLYHSHNQESNNNYQSTLIFTDRSIYRPGQTVHFKVLQIEYDKNRMPNIVKGGKRTISFYDANSQLVEELSLHFNEFGSASGSFTIPTGRLTGSYTISTTHGLQTISVEEYKRPTFEVTINKPKDTYKIGDEVILIAQAKGYAGNAVSNATYTYTVKRVVSRWWPLWSSLWRQPSWNIREDVIITADGITDDLGNFDIQFIATEANGIDSKLENLIHHFEIEVSVTDQSGETHFKKESISIARTPYFMEILCQDESDIKDLKPWKISAYNLSASSIMTQGEYSITKLREPQRPMKGKYWNVNTNRRAQPITFAFESWMPEKTIVEAKFTTEETLVFPKMEAGVYRIKAVSKDGIEATRYLILSNFQKKRFPKTAPVFTTLNSNRVMPGEQISLSLGTPEKEVWVYLQLMRANVILDSRWLRVKNTESFQYLTKDEDKGGLDLRIYYIYDNRRYNKDFKIDVPHFDKELEIELETFRDQLLPGEEEEYRIKVKDHRGNGVLAELLANMYDVSLDQLKPHHWPKPSLRTHFSYLSLNFIAFGINKSKRFLWNKQDTDSSDFFAKIEMPRIISILQPYLNYAERRSSKMHLISKSEAISADMPSSPESALSQEQAKSETVEIDLAEIVSDSQSIDGGSKRPSEHSPQSPATVRENLEETVFFFPQLFTDGDGNISFSFKMNEALTRWRLMMFSHTLEVAYGYKEMIVTTSKDVMVIPNKPRILRMGDTIVLSARVANLSEDSITAEVELELKDIFNHQSYADWISGVSKITTAIPKGQTEVVNWTLIIPEKHINMVSYTLTARAGNHTDGELNAVPVVSNRILVTESLPMFIPAGEERQYAIEALKELKSGSKIPVGFTFEATANPVWHAVQALPYLKESAGNSTDGILQQLIANAIAKSIVDANPLIQKVMKMWAETDSDQLLSNLEKNPDLKNALLEETPWVMDAIRERNRKHSITALFNTNNIKTQLADALKKLEQRQMPNGGFVWFPDGRESEYITMQVMEGIDYLHKYNNLKFSNDEKLLVLYRNAEEFLDEKFLERYLKWRDQQNKYSEGIDDYQLSNFELKYMYLKTSALSARVSDADLKNMIDFYLKQVKKHHIQKELYRQLLTGFILKENESEKEAEAILKSLTEKAGSRPDYGMYWKNDAGISWTESSIEVHAKAIQFFISMKAESSTINKLRTWLLRNKKLNDWGNRSATAMAIHSLLMQENGQIDAVKMLATKALPVRFSDNYLEYSPDELALGFVKRKWQPSEITSDLFKITISNPNSNMAFASAYWQYLEHAERVQRYKSTPLKIERVLYKEINTSSGKFLEKLQDRAELAPGDIVVSRVIIYAEQDMQFIQLKVMRAAGFEPAKFISQYRWDALIGYYHSVRDLADHYYIDYLPKGQHIFESRMVATHKGSFSLGPVSIQSLYAPDYGSISAGGRLKVN